MTTFHLTGGSPETSCPTCDSPDPRLHPAVQEGGEVQPCRDPYHRPLTPDAQRALDATPPREPTP